MAIIGTIRKRMGWLLLVFVGAALAAFILGDFFSSGPGVFGGNQQIIAEIGGEAITFQQYESMVQKRIDAQQSRMPDRQLPRETEDLIRDETWRLMIEDHVLQKELDELGIGVGEAELSDMVKGNNIDPAVMQFFTNPQTGQFDRNIIIPYLQSLEGKPEEKANWLLLEKGLLEQRAREKYFAMVEKGLYVTTAEAKTVVNEENAAVTIDFVRKDYASVPDSSITVTDADIAAYYEENKHQFQQKEERRSIDYVIFDIKPSEEDSMKVVEFINRMHTELAEAEDDEMFVNRNAQTPWDGRWHSQGSLASRLDSVFFEADTGLIIGPYYENSTYKLAKLSDIRVRPDSANIQHLVIGMIGGDSVPAYKKADSLYALATSDTVDFLELAFNNTDEPTEKADSGNIGWVTEVDDVLLKYGDQEFIDTLFTGEIGTIIMQKRPYAVHITKIVDRTAPVKQVQVAFIDEEVVFSDETFNNVYTMANEFRGKNTTPEAFTKAAEGLTKRVYKGLREGDRYISNLESPRKLVQWVFNNNKGDISPIYPFGNKIVVAMITEVNLKGYIPIAERKIELEVYAKQEKKAQQFKQEMAKAGGDLSSLANSVEGTLLTQEGMLFSASSTTTLGREPFVQGTAFGLAKGSVSKPLKGEMGVYVIEVKEVSPVDESLDYLTKKMTLNADYGARVRQGSVINALKDKAEVEDNRSAFF